MREFWGKKVCEREPKQKLFFFVQSRKAGSEGKGCKLSCMQLLQEDNFCWTYVLYVRCYACHEKLQCHSTTVSAEDSREMLDASRWSRPSIPMHALKKNLQNLTCNISVCIATHYTCPGSRYCDWRANNSGMQVSNWPLSSSQRRLLLYHSRDYRVRSINGICNISARLEAINYTRGQFYKSFTLVIYKCSYCFQLGKQ